MDLEVSAKMEVQQDFQLPIVCRLSQFRDACRG